MLPYGWPGCDRDEVMMGATMPELTGLTWSHDGERLYVGTEDVVAEYSRCVYSLVGLLSLSIV